MDHQEHGPSLIPSIISDSLSLDLYNFGMDGQTFDLQYLRHREIIKYNPKPKMVILSLDHFSLEFSGEMYNSKQFLPYLLGNDTIKAYTDSYKIFTDIDFFHPFSEVYG